MKRTSLILTLALVFFSFGYTSDTATEDISKIYLIDNMLIRMTPGKDIRFYDIANPASPTQIGSIATDGNHDVAVRGNYMYADYQEHLVVYDISNPAAAIAIDTTKNIFNNSWQREVWTNMPVDNVDQGSGFRGCKSCTTDEAIMADAGNTKGESGQGGSMTRFVIVGNYLYCVDMTSLKVFDITDPARPRYKNSVDVRWDIETIFHDGEHLFIGGSSGMYIYDISDPGAPTYTSEFTHMNSCDPVVVEGDRAYVTLRGGSRCGGFTNQLDILDISDIKNPRPLKTVPLTGPYGLAVRDSIVLVCDGADGLKVLDTRNLNDIKQIGSITGIVPHDVILRDNLLIVTAEDGYYLYDVTSLATPTRFSRLP